MTREEIAAAFRRCGTPSACGKQCPCYTKGLHCYQALREDVIRILEGKDEKEQPEQKHGHWKLVQDYYDDEHWQCSACGCEWYLEAGNPEENNMHYCPECGAKMNEEVKQNETD